MKSVAFFTVFLAQAAMASSPPAFKHFQCAGSAELIAVDTDTLDVRFQQESAPDAIFTASAIPHSESTAFETVRVSAQFPLRACTFEQGFSVQGECHAKSLTVTLEGAFDSDPIKPLRFDVTKSIQEAASLKIVFDQTGRHNSVKFELRLGNAPWISERPIFPLYQGKSNRCVVDETFEIL